jgi:ssDNA-specific exonuclease RecJ
MEKNPSRNKFKMVDSEYSYFTLYPYREAWKRNYDALNNEKDGLVSDIYDIIRLIKPHMLARTFGQMDFQILFFSKKDDCMKGRLRKMLLD